MPQFENGTRVLIQSQASSQRPETRQNKKHKPRCEKTQAHAIEDTNLSASTNSGVDANPRVYTNLSVDTNFKCIQV